MTLHERGSKNLVKKKRNPRTVSEFNVEKVENVKKYIAR